MREHKITLTPYQSTKVFHVHENIKYKKCGKVIAEPKEFIKIEKDIVVLSYRFNLPSMNIPSKGGSVKTLWILLEFLRW